MCAVNTARKHQRPRCPHRSARRRRRSRRFWAKNKPKNHEKILHINICTWDFASSAAVHRPAHIAPASYRHGAAPDYGPTQRPLAEASDVRVPSRTSTPRRGIAGLREHVQGSEYTATIHGDMSWNSYRWRARSRSTKGNFVITTASIGGPGTE